MKETVTITGSSGSLGLALAKKFFNNNYPLILHSRKKNKRLLDFKNKKNFFIYGDLENIKTIKQLSKKINQFNSNIIINNAGIYLNKSFNNLKIKQINKIINVNFLSNILILKNLKISEKKKYLLININSVAGVSGSANESIYSASKHALKGFFDSIEQEPSNKFDIMNIYPGAFKSKITKNRKDFKNLMNSNEIANLIFENIKKYSSLKINNIFLKRKLY
jgi:short-subunit dehydrogenase